MCDSGASFLWCVHDRARICKRLRRPGIDSEESIPPAYVAWRASTTNRVVVPVHQAGNRFLVSLKGLQIWAQYCSEVGRRPALCASSIIEDSHHLRVLSLRIISRPPLPLPLPLLPQFLHSCSLPHAWPLPPVPWPTPRTQNGKTVQLWLHLLKLIISRYN